MEDYGAAIGLFARSPALGQVKTRLAAAIGDRAALDLYLSFVADCIVRIGKLDLQPLDRYLYLTSSWKTEISPLPDEALKMTIRYQAEGDLGERMKAALLEIFTAGHWSGIITGTDSPSLPSE